MTPKMVVILLVEYRIKWLDAAIGKRTTAQIECPHIIDGLPVNLTTKDEELGTDHGCGMVPTTTRPEHTDCWWNPGPLLRFWRANA